MDNALAFLFFAGIALLVASWPRLTSKSRAVRRIYRHIDEPLGARRYELDRRAGRRRILGFFSRDLANLVYPSAQLGGAAALPSTSRMRRYVKLEWGPPPPLFSFRPWNKPRSWRLFPPWRVWHITALELRWTSEANALGEGFGTLLTRKVAQALILKHASELDQIPAFERGFFRLERAKPLTAVPASVPFGEATDE